VTLVRQVLRTPAGAVGGVLAVGLVLVAVFGPLIHGADPDLPDFSATLRAPSGDHLLGTDTFGRDQLARLMVGARQSLAASSGIVAAVFAIGLVVGLVSGLVGGVVDAVLSRVIDITLAIPSLIFALAVVGALGPGFGNLVIALMVANWATFARLARALAMTARHRPDLVAARLAGVGWWRRSVAHVVPGAATQMLAVATLEVGSMIVSLAGLSFLGLGAQPPSAEWGTMLSESRGVFTVAPWLLLGPLTAVFLVVASSVLLGDALRDVIDPGNSSGSVRPTSGRSRSRTGGRHTGRCEP
jgi:nickel transport system permease protein